MLLEPFRVETLTQEHAAGLAATAGRYGEAWTRDVINGWFGQGRQYGTDRHEWVEGLPGLCEALRVAGRPEVARLLTGGTWRWLHDELRTWTTTAAQRDPSTAVGAVQFTAGAAARRGMRHTARGDRRGTAPMRGHGVGVPDAGTAFGRLAAGGGLRRDRTRLRTAARHDPRATAARRRRLVDRVDRLPVRAVRHAGIPSVVPRVGRSDRLR